MNQSSTTAPSFTAITSTTSTTKTWTASAAGTYYVWVKDVSGRTNKASFTVASTAFGSTVTYICNGNRYTETVSSGSSVLSPTTFTPSLSEATFLGWSSSSSSTTVLTSKVADGNSITLYAVFKYNDVSIGVLGGHYYEGNFSVTYSGAKYSSISITCKIGRWSGGEHASVHIKQTSPSVAMLNQYICSYGEEVDNKVLTANFEPNGTYIIYNELNGGDGGARAGVKYGTLYGRTVVG